MDGGATIPMGLAGSASRPDWADRAADLMKQDEWSAAELEMLGLAELPGTARRIHEWMKREQVLAREVRERGGVVFRYNLYSMPAKLRRAIALALSPWAFDAADLAAGTRERAFVADLRALDGLPPKQALRGAARAEAVRAFERWSGAAGQVGTRGADRFASLWAAGAILAPEWLRDALPEFCAKSLLTWQRQLTREGMRALAGAYKPRQALLDLAPELGNIAVGILASFPHITAARIHEHLAGEAEDDGLQAPSLRAVERWLAKWKAENALTFAQVRNPDQARSTRMPAFGDAAAAAHGLNVVWEMDTTPQDLTLADGKRWTIIGIIDVWSRDVVLRLVERNSGHAARMTFRQALLSLGVPQMLRTDNGSDLRNRETAAMLAALGVDLPPMPIGRPDLKPFIERVFRTLQHDLVPLLPGFTGHNVADAQALRSRVSFIKQLFKQGVAPEVRLTPGQMQNWLDTWCEGYRKRRHSMLGMSPAEKRALWSGPVRRIEDERALDMLLAPLAGGDGARIVSKHGIKADGGRYAAPELGDLVGERVMCRQDPTDAGRLYVFGADGTFICIAEDWRLTGTDPKALAEAAKAVWRQAVKDGAGEMRAKGRLIDKATLAVDLANRRAAKATSVVAFPRAPEAHSTPALEEMGRAARADEAPRAPVRSEADALRQLEAERAFAARQAAQRQEQAAEATKESRLARARAVCARLAAGLPFIAPDEKVAALPGGLTDADRAWFETYRTSPEWRWACTVDGLDPATGTSRNKA